MLKNSIFKKITIIFMIVAILLTAYFFPKKEKFVIPEEVIYVDEMLTIPIYTKEQNNYVARTMVSKKNDNDIEYIISVLTKNSENSKNLPINFYPLIPENTKLLDYQNIEGLLKINFSKEFLNINKDDEIKLIESLIYSLCELNNVNKIMLFIENEKLNELPNSKIKLPNILDKSFGINKKYESNNIKNSIKTTIYYLGKYNDEVYYIPITKITNDTRECIEIIIDELKKSSVYENNLLSYLNASYELQNYEILENSISLSFNNKLLANINDDDMLEKVKYSISYSLKDTYNIDDIIININ